MPTPSWGFGLNFTLLGKPFLTTSNIGSPFIVLIKTLLNSTQRRRERHRRSEFNSNSFRWWKRWDAKYGLWSSPKVVPTAKAIATPGLERERRVDASRAGAHLAEAGALEETSHCPWRCLRQREGNILASLSLQTLIQCLQHTEST